MSNSSAKFQTSRNFSFKNLLRIIPEIIQRDKLFVRCAGDPVAVFLAQVIEVFMNNKTLELQLCPLKLQAADCGKTCLGRIFYSEKINRIRPFFISSRKFS
ncbi:MAG: hypothetical protein HY808_12815 [Nitrospirae bacterium]|nr:hypothetical protein [Nitrospirota bacterium]